MSKSSDINLKTVIRWQIENFIQVREMRLLESEKHHVPGSFGKIALSLQFLPKSTRRKHYTSLYLNIFPSKSLEITFKYKLYILKDNQQTNVIQFTNHFNRSETCQGIRCGMTDFIKKSDIQNLLDDKGALNIHCRFKAINYSYRLSGNLMPLLTSGNYSDAVVVVHGHEFKVQKAVMASRSSVFYALFQKTSRIHLTDNIDARTFAKLLHFIYTGKFSFDGDLKLIEAVNKFRIA